MKAKIQKKKVDDSHKHMCFECGFAKEDTKFINKNLKGEYFMLKCPFNNWVRFKHDIACDRFITKDKLNNNES